MVAPYGERELEADDEGAAFLCARAERVRGVEGRGVGGVGRVVSTHIKALHGR